MALVVPEGPAWSLPAYELAFQTADRAFGAGFDDVTISVVTPEPAPLDVLGAPVSAAVQEALESRRRDGDHRVARRGARQVGSWSCIPGGATSSPS